MVELGARYGTWGVRCIKALQQLYPHAEHLVYLVDWMQAASDRCREHCRANGVTCRVMTGGIGVGDSEYISALSITAILDDIMTPDDIIDFLDLDIQGAELPAFIGTDGLMQQLAHRVRRVHIGTHSAEIQAQIKRFFLAYGWDLAIEYHGRHGDGDYSVGWDSLQDNTSKLQNTAFGPVFVRDGILGFSNPALMGRTARGVQPWQPQTSEESCENSRGSASGAASRWIESKKGQAALAIQRSVFANDFSDPVLMEGGGAHFRDERKDVKGAGEYTPSEAQASAAQASAACADGWLLRIPEDVMALCRRDEERWYRTFAQQDGSALGEACWRNSSQGLQDLVLEHIFAKLGSTNRYFVEMGFDGTGAQGGGAGSNTFALWERGWTGLRLDSSHANASINLHREWIYPANVVDILLKHQVPDSPDYISIDLDSYDIWIFRALLAGNERHGGFRPRVVSIEFNPDFGWASPLTFPDPTWEGASSTRTHTSWDEKSCFMGSSAAALVAAATELGYVPVYRESAFDIFFVRADLISGCESPTFGHGSLSPPLSCGECKHTNTHTHAHTNTQTHTHTHTHTQTYAHTDTNT